MDYKEYEQLYGNRKIIPVYKRFNGDMYTPVVLYKKLRRNNRNVFLLESAEGIGKISRYSYICLNPVKTVKNYGSKLVIKSERGTEEFEKNIFEYLKEESESFTKTDIPGLPDFTGGYVGYIGYSDISLIEDVVELKEEEFPPDSILSFYDKVVAYDHYTNHITILCNTFVKSSSSPRQLFEEAEEAISKIKEEIEVPVKNEERFSYNKEEIESISKNEFTEKILKCKDNIKNGDVFQIVLSHRFSASYEGDPFNVYRALRSINPSPYMYYMDMDELIVTGTSPEDLIKVKNGTAEILPIAGTRRRGRDAEEDLALEEELLADPKELAEHTMLVDLARNDLGRVCKFGSIKVVEKMKIQRFSHVMHIVSRVRGKLQEGKTGIDALMASFPAGTVTGAPKIKAMQLLNEYENVKRTVYAGAIGYLDFSGNMDMCIAIRTLYADKDKFYWQAGAGIVLDSKPELEIKEIYNKSAVMVQALDYAGEIQ